VKHIIRTIIITLVLLVSPGCQTTIAPGADPVVVRTQQVLEISLSTVDNFLKYERKHNKSPAVHAVAETLRKEFPAVFRVARSLLVQYQTTKDPETLRLMQNYTAQVEGFATKALQAK
jgi:hypothetical protein